MGRFLTRSGKNGLKRQRVCLFLDRGEVGALCDELRWPIRLETGRTGRYRLRLDGDKRAARPSLSTRLSPVNLEMWSSTSPVSRGACASNKGSRRYPFSNAHRHKHRSAILSLLRTRHKICSYAKSTVQSAQAPMIQTCRLAWDREVKQTHTCLLGLLGLHSRGHHKLRVPSVGEHLVSPFVHAALFLSRLIVGWSSTLPISGYKVRFCNRRRGLAYGLAVDVRRRGHLSLIIRTEGADKLFHGTRRARCEWRENEIVGIAGNIRP
ncbi:hypothetical protein QBC34DRAFT_92874 [Podospora aff. communis PSN243]|uniref:Uncharacterized protein n=1 Tax=Podospora aff. communis PSN243 TaxID=3040156 RepID=A0AAV9GSA0_9PEZI|nr:hypothetical protein QBC34DRAFT_92874 [Podospora aff. communis PSN243]